MFNPMNGYPQHQSLNNIQYQGHQHGPSQKRAKTNTGMVTTKYAPPPGYVPPAHQNISYPAWPQAAAPYGSMYPAAYSQSYPGYAAYQFNQSQHQHQYPVNYAQQMLVQSQHNAPMVPHTAHPTGSAVHWPQSWMQPNSTATFDEPALRRRHNSAPDASSKALATINEASRDRDQEPNEHDEDYCEFTRPCFFAEREGDVQKELSLGLIISKTALPSNTPLPATWHEANTQALAPPATAQAYQADRCVSKYHADSHDHDLQSVRESSTWKTVEDDIIFRTFPRIPRDVLRHPDLIAQYRARNDKHRQTRKHSSTSDDVSKKRGIVEDADREDGSDRKRSRQHPGNSERPSDGMLSINGTSSHHTTDKQVEKIQEESQEDVLARLGVTGAAKPVSHRLQDAEEIESMSKLETTAVAQDDAICQNINSEANKESSSHVPVLAGDGSALARSTEVTAKSQEKIQTKPAVKESRWTQLAREYQTGQKRPYDE